MHVQAVLVPVIVRAPDGLANGIIGYDVPAVIGQPLQQGALGGGQGQRCAVGAADGGVLQIDRAVPQRQHPAAAQLGAVGALQKVLHAQKQLLHQERLGQIVVRAKPQPEQPVRVGVPRREKQRRDVSLRPQGAEQPEAVAVRQVDVQDHQVGAVRGKGRPRRGAVCGGAYGFIASRAQVVRDKGEQIRVVIDQKDGGIVDGGHKLSPSILPPLVRGGGRGPEGWPDGTRFAGRLPATPHRLRAELPSRGALGFSYSI